MATALETASLVMVPSGYEDGTLGSLQPLDGTGDFTFTRGSNISATRVNEDGYIEKGYENLLLQSNNFNTSPWTTAGTLTPNQTGYDGSTNAWLYEKSAAFQQVGQLISQSGVLTFSVYLKAGSYEWVRLRISNLENAYYHLTEDGSLGSVAGGDVISTKIDSVGNEWYRCSISVNSAISDVKIYPALGNNDMGTIGTIYIQDAQLNQGLVAYPYLETTTTSVKGGILEDMPRLDYSSGRCSLLLEPARTNLVPYSEYFGGWQTASSPTITANAAVSPEGVNNAYLLTSTAVSSRVQVPVSPTGTNIQSVYIKYAGSDARVRISGLASSNSRFEVNVTSSGVAPHSAESGIIDYAIESAGNNWYRVTSTQSGGNYYQIYVDVTGNNGSIYIWGAQLEQDATYPTSYIPTYGVSQTRLKDVCEVSDIASLIGQNEGTILFDFVRGNPATGNTDNIGLSGGSNRLTLFFINNSNLAVLSILDSNGFRNVNFGLGFVTGERYKVALKYTNTQLKAYRNGTLFVTTDLFGFTETLNTFSFNTFGLVPQGQKYNQALVFPTALSDEACIELTTI